VSTELSVPSPSATALTGPFELDPRVALRPEPFGALAYHYGNRRLVFLRSEEMVQVVKSLADHPTIDAALEANGVEPRRRAAFTEALAGLRRSEIIRAR
jgi:putative mycofactocin binding protein MftB